MVNDFCDEEDDVETDVESPLHVPMDSSVDIEQGATGMQKFIDLFIPNAIHTIAPVMFTLSVYMHRESTAFLSLFKAFIMYCNN